LINTSLHLLAIMLLLFWIIKLLATDTNKCSSDLINSAASSSPLNLRFNGNSHMNIRIVNLINSSNIPNVSMVRVLNLHNLSTLLHVVDTTEQGVHFLESDFPCLGDEEDHEECKEDVYSSEEVECVEASRCEELREELVENKVGDVLPLRAHADCLSTNVHGKDFRRPDPGRGTPGRLVEEDEQEEQERESNSNWLVLGKGLDSAHEIEGVRRCITDDTECEHACSHAKSPNDEEEFSAISIDSPDGVQCEEDTTSSVDGIDQVDSRGIFVNTLVDLRRVRVQSALAGQLLSTVDDEGDVETLSN